MAFEEQFSQISEFAQAKIALEQERTRIKKLDRIAEETRQRQTELFDVQLRQAQQAAQSTQMKLDEARLEQKHTSALASAWVAMMGETDENETLARKGAGTGRMTTTVGSREQTASLTPDGRVVVGASSLRPMEDTGRGGDNRVLFQAENGSDWVEDPTGVRVRVPEPSYTVQYKVPGASSTAKDAYRKALVDAARESPAAIQLFSQISQAFVTAENMPKHLKMADESALALLQYRQNKAAGVGSSSENSVEAARAIKMYTDGAAILETEVAPETADDIQKAGDGARTAIKDKAAMLATRIGQNIGLLNIDVEISSPATKALAGANKMMSESQMAEIAAQVSTFERRAAKLTYPFGSPQAQIYEGIIKDIEEYRGYYAQLGSTGADTETKLEARRNSIEYAHALYSDNVKRGYNHITAAHKAAADVGMVANVAARAESKLRMNPVFMAAQRPDATAKQQAEALKLVDDAVAGAYKADTYEAAMVRRLLQSKILRAHSLALFTTKAPAPPPVKEKVKTAPSEIKSAQVSDFSK